MRFECSDWIEHIPRIHVGRVYGSVGRDCFHTGNMEDAYRHAGKALIALNREPLNAPRIEALEIQMECAYRMHRTLGQTKLDAQISECG